MYVSEFSSVEEAQEAAAETYVPVAIRESRSSFRVRFALHELEDAVTTTHVRSSPARTIRTPRLAAHTGRDDLLIFCVHLSGTGRLRQHDRLAELSRGTGVLSEVRSPWELDFPVDTQSLTLQFPRGLLSLGRARVSDHCARTLDPKSPAMRLAAGYLGQLHGLVDELTGEQRIEAGRVAINLLSMAMRDGAQDGSHAAVGEVVLRMMQRYVQDHLADPQLSVTELALRHHISVRQVHALFARADLTPGAYIRQRRLAAAHEMLASARYDTSAVADIAAAVGFAELRTFERAFRRQYGTTPSNQRRESRAGVPGGA
jgi:AraC-like DNA-binding protein